MTESTTPAQPNPNQCLVVKRGPYPGAKIPLTKASTIIGDHGKRLISIVHTNDMFRVAAADATVLVTRNGDPLPPVPKRIEDQDILRFRDFEIVCRLRE